MKNILLTAALLLVAGASYAQDDGDRDINIGGESVELDYKLKSTSQNIVTASYEIRLKPGFEANHAHINFNRFYTSLSIDDSEVFPPDGGLTGGSSSNNEGGVVGAIGGMVDVSSLGGATYTIPIEVPSGINGMQPSLAITYNSQAGGGLLGYGWDLSGISSITRTGSTLYHDGRMTAADFSGGDRFLLDGQRLIKVGEGGGYEEYKTEQDEFSKIIFYKDGDEFSRCEVWQENGCVVYYGSTDASDNSRLMTPDGSHVMKWMVSRVEDRNGNAMMYDYDNSQKTGEIYLKRIDYTINAKEKIEPEFSVFFGYLDKNRQDYRYSYIGGHMVQDKKLLDEIIVAKNDDGLDLLKYSFSYSETGYGGSYDSMEMFTRLLEINLTKDGVSLNPTIVSWTGGEAVNALTLCDHLTNSIYDNFIFVGDFNGDGFSDIATVPFKPKNGYADSVVLKVHLNYSISNRHYFDENPACTVKLPKGLDWVDVADLNEDGYDDLLVYHNVDSKKTRYVLYENQKGDGFTEVYSVDSEKDEMNVLIGDFFGDNSTSALLFNLTYGEDYENGYTIIGYRDGKYYSRKYFIEEFLDPEYCYIIDYNGDGREEVLFVDEGWSYVYEFDADIALGKRLFEINDIKSGNYLFPCDVNGDGKTDLLYYDNSVHGRMRVFISNGTKFLESNMMPVGNWTVPENIYQYYHSLKYVDTNPYFAVSVTDIDGNGQSDILQFMRAASSPHLSCSVLFNFDDKEGKFLSSYHPNIGEVNTTGVLDCRTQYVISGYFESTDNVSLLTLRATWDIKWPVLFSMRSSALMYSVKTITDGLGNSTSFKYKCFVPNYKNYGDMKKFGISPSPNPFMTLLSYTTKNAGGKEDETSFSFSDAMYHKNGRGYVGFGSIARTKESDKQKVEYQSTYFELKTMGMNAALLPSVDSLCFFKDGKKTLSETSFYTFNKVTCSRESYNGINHIIRPAMAVSKTIEHDIDNPKLILSQTITDYKYTFSNGTYDNTYCCTKESYGVSDNQNDTRALKHYIITETDFLEQDYTNWVINRKAGEKSTVGMKGKPEIYSRRIYEEYCSSNPFLVKRVKDIPSLDDNDRQSTLTNYEYDNVGNIIFKSVSAPFGRHDEKPETVSYVYHNNKRLVKEKIVAPEDLAYKESYGYDRYDRIFERTNADGLVTIYTYDNPFGNTVTTINPDSTRTVKAVRWSQDNDMSPKNSVYYKWTKTSGGAAAMEFYNAAGDVVRTVTYDYKHNAVITDNEYDGKGRLARRSLPYSGSDAIMWDSISYDDFGRVSKTISADSVIVEYSYNGYEVTSTVEAGGVRRSSSRKFNSVGWMVNSTDANNAKVTYDYYSDGNIAKAVTSEGMVKLEVEYDNAGNKTILKDPDYGLSKSTYDAFGRLREQTTPKNKKTTYKYDIIGRMTDKTCDGIQTVFNYNEHEHKGKLESVVHKGQIVRYNYDDFQRPVSVTETINDRTYTTMMSYDKSSRINNLTFPSGFSVKYDYFCNGQNYIISDHDGNLLWRTDEMNAAGQLRKATTGNGAVMENLFNDKTHELLESTVSKNIQKFVYSYDKFGNLAARKDNINNVEETFTYDSINRLTGIKLKGGLKSSMAYDKFGRMVKKRMEGKTIFDEAEFCSDRPHAMETANADTNMIDVTQNIMYTAFDKVSTIRSSVGTAKLAYGFDEQRISMSSVVDGITRSKTYVGNCEFITESGAEKVLTYLTGPYGVFAVVVEEAGVESIHYIYKDHLGSWTTVTDSDGKVEQRQSFDAWGNRRNAATWSGPATDEPMFDRGFTGHEHLYAFGLINMNGRMYDPMTSSLLSPDNYVQDPTSQQGFNRYAYCFYNPLKYVDPSGYRCDNPPYQLQVQQYLMCMNAENAEALNNVGITHVQVNSSQGYSGSYVQYQVAGEWYGFHYNGYVDVGYDDGYGGQTTYSDGSLPTPPTPMYWNEGGGCGGGAAYSGGGFSKPVVPVDGRNQNASNVSKYNGVAQLGSVMGNVIGPSVEHIFKKEAKLLEKAKSQADKYYYKIFSKASKIGKHVGVAGALITEGVYVKGYIDGEISGKELRIRTEINVAEFAIPWVATAVAPLIGAAAAPVLIGAGILTIGIIVYDAFGGFDNIIYDNSIVTP